MDGAGHALGAWGRPAVLGGGGPRLAAHRQRRALGFQEPLLPDAALSRHRPGARRAAALEPLPLQRPPFRRRPAIAPVHADHAALRLGGPLAVDAALRPRGLRPPPARGARDDHAVPPPRLATGGSGRRRDDLHPRRLGLREAAAHGDDPVLRLLSPRALAPGGGAGPALLRLRRLLRRRRRPDDGRPRPGRLPVRPHPRRRRRPRDRHGRAAGSPTFAGGSASFWPWARSGRCSWPCRRSSPCSSCRPRRGPPSASASRPWARCRPKASPRSCSATSSARCATPTTTGGRTSPRSPRAPGRTGPPTTSSSAPCPPCFSSGTASPAAGCSPASSASSSGSAFSRSSTRSGATPRSSRPCSTIFPASRSTAGRRTRPSWSTSRSPSRRATSSTATSGTERRASPSPAGAWRCPRPLRPWWSPRSPRPSASQSPPARPGRPRARSASGSPRRRSPPPSSGARPTPAALLVAAALVLATGAELIWRNAASALNAEPAGRYAVFQELPPEQLQGLQILKRELAERHARGERPRLEILGLSGAWQNASMVLGLEDTIGYNPLRLADYEKAVGPGENAVDPNLRQFPGTFRGYRCRLAGLLGLEYLVLDRPVEKLPRHFPRLVGREAALRLRHHVDLPLGARHAPRAVRLAPRSRRLGQRARRGRAAGIRPGRGGPDRPGQPGGDRGRLRRRTARRPGAPRRGQDRRATAATP